MEQEFVFGQMGLWAHPRSQQWEDYLAGALDTTGAGVQGSGMLMYSLLTFPFLGAEFLHCGCIPCSGLRAAALRGLWPHAAACPGAAGLEEAFLAPIASLWKAQQMFPCSAHGPSQEGN